ncbi:MAG: glycosyltransferase family 4 protein [Candidatus Eisenbacteria bacterium]|nr:glycosyltransferase family 4 protein [Candidatus Eisenbacteria bacterium]
MRVLFVDSGRSWRGGQYQVLNLGTELHKRGHEVLLVCQRKSPLQLKWRERGLLGEATRIRSDLDVKSWFRLAGILRAFEPAVVHAHTGHSHAVALGASFIHDVNALVVTRRVASPIRRTFLNRMKYSRFVTRFVAISSSVAKTLEDAGVSPERISVIPSSVRIETSEGEESRLETRSKLGLSEEDFVVLNVGRLSAEKRQETVLEVAAVASEKVARAKFIVVGEGRLRGRLERRARELGVEEQVRFLGFREDVPRLMRIADVFLFPSVSEGLGTSVLEAMAAGVPVVASRTGGIVEIVEDGATGFLAEPDDVDSMAEAVVRLAGEPELSGAMSARARVVAKDHSFARSGESHEKLYHELAG